MNIRVWNLTATVRRFLVLIALSTLIAACGGGGGGGDGGNPPVADKTPDPMTFEPAPDFLPGTLATSGKVTVSGLGVAVQASVSAGGEISVNGGAWTSEPVTVENGDVIRVRGIAGDTPEGITDITLTVGTASATFQIPTAPAGTIADTRPDAFELPEPDPATVEPGDVITSEPVVIGGINTGTQASVTGIEGAVPIIDGAPVDGGSATVFPGQSVQISLPAPETSNSVTEAVLVIGGVSEAITVVTPPAEGELDAVPDAFAGEIPVDGGDPDAAEPGQMLVFGPLAVTGLATDVPVAITNGEFSVDGGANWTTDVDITVTTGASLLVRVRAPELPAARTEARLIVGGVSTFFAVTTKTLPPGSDTEPDVFEFTAQGDVEPGSQVTSNPVTITGIDAPAAISIENGEYRIDGGQFTSSGGVVAAGQTVEVRVTVGNEPGAETVATLSIGSVSAEFRVRTDQNLPPVANAGVDRTVDESTGVTLDGSASTDEDRATLQFAWQAPEDVTLSDINAEKPTFTAPDVTADTPLTFTLTVTDAESVAASDTVTVLVKNVAVPNQPPEANAGPDQSANEGAQVVLDGSASEDPEGGSLSFAWQAPDGIVLSSTTAVSPTFTAPNVATDTPLTFTLTVTDDANVSATDTVVVNVLFVNNEPIANAGNDQTVDEGATATLNGSGSDPDGGEVTFAWRQLSGTPVTLNNAGQATATFTAPNVTANDALTFVLEVTDANDVKDTDTVVVNVTFVNQPPTANAGQDRSLNELGSTNLVGIGSDPDGGSVTFEWAQIAGTGSLTNANAATATYTAPEVVTDMVATFRLRVRDAANTVTDDFVTVTVRQVADTRPAPFDFVDIVATPGATTRSNVITLTDFKDAVAVNLSTTGAIGSVNPVIGDVVRPNGSPIQPGQTLAVQIGSAAPGATGTITVNIGGETATIAVTYTVPPVARATANPSEVQGGDTVNLDASTSSDSNGSVVAYAWTQVAGTPVTLTGADTAAASFTAPVVAADQSLIFRLTVTDNDGLTDDSDVAVLVREANTPPVANAGPDQASDEGTLVTLDASGSTDNEGHSLTFLWEQVGGTPVTLSNVTSASPAFDAPVGLLEDELLVFKLTVDDLHFEGVSSDTVFVTIRNTGAELTLDFPPTVALTDVPLANAPVLTYRGYALPGNGPGIQEVTVNGNPVTFFDPLSGFWHYDHPVTAGIQGIQAIEIVVTEVNGETTRLTASLEHVEDRTAYDFQTPGNGILFSRLNAIALGPDGRLYFGSTGGAEVYYFDVSRSAFGLIPQSPSTNNGSVLSVDPAGDRVLLASANTMGDFGTGGLAETLLEDGTTRLISRDFDGNNNGIDLDLVSDLSVDYGTGIAYVLDQISTFPFNRRVIAIDLTTGTRSLVAANLSVATQVDLADDQLLLSTKAISSCGLSALNLTSGTVTEVVPEATDFCVNDVDGVPGELIAYGLNRNGDGGSGEISLIDYGSGNHFEISGYSDLNLGPVPFDDKGIVYDAYRDVVFVHDHHDTAGQDMFGVIMVDLQTGQRVVLFQSE